MKTKMTKLFTALAMAIGLATAATAATPVAVWDGDFSTTTKGAYTLNANGNNVADDGSSITIDQSKGVLITATGTSPFGAACSTVIVKFTGLANPDEGAQALVASVASTPYQGLAVQPKGNAQAIWQSGLWGSGKITDGSFVLSATTTHTLAFVWRRSNGTGTETQNGTKVHLDGTQKAYWSGLYGDYSPTGVVVGGPADAVMTSISAATGMQIEKIAVFNSAISAADVAAYKFPSEETPTKMYSNRLSTGDVVVPAGTYGAITVPGDGIQGTAFTAAANLSNTASGIEITGSYESIIKNVSNNTDIYAHTLMGWFKVDALPTSTGADNAKTIYAAKSGDGNYCGYKVAVDSTGKIYVGQCDNEAWRNDSGTSTIYTTDAQVTAGQWFHLAVSVPGYVSARTTTATVFVNGIGVATSGGPFGTNLNNSKCSYVRIGTKGVTSDLGISAAGIYVDSAAICNGTTVQALATNPKYVKRLGHQMLFRLPLDGDGEKSADSTGAQDVTKSGTADFTYETTIKKFGTASLKVNTAAAHTIEGIETTKEGGWTFAFWMHPNSMGTWKDVLAFAIGDKIGKFERKTGTAMTIYAGNTGGITLGDDQFTYVDSAWNHIAVVSTSVGFDIYLNGTKVLSETFSTDSGLSKVFIGNSGFNGARTSLALVDDVAIFNWSLTPVQLAKLQTAEASMDLFNPTVTKGVKWGNLGTSEVGSATSQDGKFGNTTWTVNFSVDDNIVNTGIGKTGRAKVNSIKLMQREDIISSSKPSPDSITLTQGSISVTSSARSEVESVSIWSTTHTELATRNCYLYTFASSAEFDVSQDITMTFNTANGCSVVKVCNSKMQASSWSPAIEFDCDYDSTIGRTISINFCSSQGSVSGTYGIVPSSTWNNTDTSTSSSGTEFNVSDGSKVTVKWWSSGNYSYTSGITDNAIKGYLDDGGCGDGTGGGPRIKIESVPFKYYDIIVYQATDTENWGFNPPAVGAIGSSVVSTAYSYDGTTSADRNSTTLKFGKSRNATAVVGVNVVYLKKGFSSSSLDIKGGNNTNSARGCIAAIQIVEVFPDVYQATVDSTPAKWSTQDGLTQTMGSTWHNNPQSSIYLENTTLETATVNFDTYTEAGKLGLTSGSGNATTFAGWSNIKFGAYDFDNAAGSITFDARGVALTADSNLRTTLRKATGKKYIFWGEGSNGMTLDYGSTSSERVNESPLVASHLVFDGGTHTFKSTSENAAQRFGANATADNPTFYVKGGATLNLYSRNPCGWSPEVDADGIIRIAADSKVKTMTSEIGTWYWNQQFYLDPGASLELAASPTCLTGGADADKPHFFMPASENGVATISSSGSGAFCLTKDGHPGVGVNVGAGSTLNISAALGTSDNNNTLAKFGAGTVKFTGNIGSYTGKMQISAGEAVIETTYEMKATVTVASGATFVLGNADFTASGVIGGEGAVAKRGDSTVKMTGVNTHTGGTTVEAGTLEVTTPNGAYTINGGTFKYAQDISAGGEFAKPTIAAVADGGTVLIQATMSKDEIQSETEIAVATVQGTVKAADLTITIINADTKNEVTYTKRTADGVVYVTPQGAKQDLSYTPTASGDFTWTVGSTFGDKQFRDYDNVTFATATPTAFSNMVDVASKVATTTLTVGGKYVFTNSTIVADEVRTTEGADATFENDVIADAVIVTNGTVMAEEIVASEVAVTNATFGSKVVGPSMKYVRLSITATQGSGEKPAVGEFRLYRGSAATGYTTVDWPKGTKVTEAYGDPATDNMTVTKESEDYPCAVGTSNECQPGCLIDGYYGNSGTVTPYTKPSGYCTCAYNKWWMSDKSGPWIVTIEFPDPVATFSGCNFCLSDYAPRNPTAWTIAVSSDGENWTTVNTTTGATWSGQWAWCEADDKPAKIAAEDWPAFVNTGTTPTDVKVGDKSTIVADGTWTAALEVGGAVTFKGVAGANLTLDAASKSKFDDGAALTFDLTAYDVSSAGKQYVVAGPTDGWPEVGNITVVPKTFSLYKDTQGYYVVVENGNYWIGEDDAGAGTWDLRNTAAWATNATETTKKLVWLNGGAAFFTRKATVTIDADADIAPTAINVTSNNDIAVSFKGAAAKLTGVPFSIGSTNVTVTIENAADMTLGTVTAVTDSQPVFIKKGAGTLTVNSGYQFSGGSLKVTKGSILLGSNNNLAGIAVISAEGEGVVDVNGKNAQRAYTLGAGGSLVNNGDDITTSSAQMNGLTVTGNATVGGSGDFGLLAWQYGATTLNLGANTLTKTGANSFWLCNTTISGTGTIQVDEGTLAVDSGTAKDASFAEGTISVGASGSLLIANNRTLTVSNVTLAAANGVTANGTLKLTGTLDAKAAGATIGKLTFSGTPTVKLTAEPLTITTLAFGTDATTVNLDFTDAPFTDWATAEVTATQMVAVASFPAARLGTVTGVADGWYVDITATGITLNHGTSAKESAISDQTDLGSVYVPGTLTLGGSGGALATSLALAQNAKITLDLIRTPLKVSAKPAFGSGAKIALASAYAETTRGKLTLISWVGGSLGLDAAGLKALIDTASLKSGVDYTVEETGDDTLRQLVLKIGDYDANGTVITIAQFGDSITEGIWRSGYRGTPNYRIPLMQMLEAKGYKPEARGFRNMSKADEKATVPSSTDANGVPAPDAYAWHTGISAQRIYTGLTGNSLRAGFMESIEAHLEQVGVTDVITLKIGTNDAIGGETAENIFEGYTNLVWKIKNMRPTSQIYLCSPIPNHNSTIADALAKAAAENMKAYIDAGHFGGNVYFIDGYNAVPNEDKYYLTDKVHPNWNGYMLLANTFATNITARFTSESPRATASYVAKATRTAEKNVLETYRNGYVKLLTFTNVTDKSSAWTSGIPYTYTNEAYMAKKFDRIAYYVENKTSASPDTRFVWVDMDAAEVGRSVTDFCIPTNVQKHMLVKNLHVYSNSSAIENVEPTVSGVNGTIMLTSKGCTAAGSISGAPTSEFGLDWNNTLGNVSWGIMNVSRIFADRTKTNHRKAVEAQILFGFNGYHLTQGNVLGIGDFAVHCKQSVGNSEQGTKTLGWIFASDNITSMNADKLDYGVVEIWAKQGPEGAVMATAASGTTNWSQLEWTDESGDKFTGLTGAFAYTLTAADGATVNFDVTVAATSIAIVNSANETVTLRKADGVTIPTGLSYAQVAGKAVISWPVSALATSTDNVAYSGGTAGDTAVAISHGAAGTVLNLIGGTYKLSESHGDNATTVNVTDSTLNYSDVFGEGKGDYVVGGSSVLNATRFILVQGSGNNCTFTLKDTAEVNVSSSTIADSNQNGVMFGHWGGNSTFTIQDTATFTATNTQILVGKTGGNQTINVNGGTIKTKGIRTAGIASGTNTLNLNGGSLVLGEIGIAAYGYSIAVNVTENSTISFTTNAPITQAIAISADKTLTLGIAENCTNTISGAVTGSGNITATGTGTLVLSGDASGYTGVVEVPAGMTVKANASWLADGKLKFANETCKLVILDQIAYDGNVSIELAAESAQPASITVKNASDESHDYGTVTVTGELPNLTATYTPWVSGKSALWAWEFNGSLASDGRNTGSMGNDHGPFYTDENDGIYAYSQPYNGLTWPTEFTTAIACTLPTNANVCLVGWGQASPGGIALTSGDVTKNEVKMVYWQNNAAYTELATMTVPNAFDCEHLYVFSKTASGVKVYLDGSLVVNYTGALSLGVGVQVGTVYQGVGKTGLARLDEVYTDGTNSCKSVVNTLRVYDAVLGEKAIAELVEEFKYVSPNGTYSRALTGTENTWKQTEAWTKTKEGEEKTQVDEPGANATVAISAAAAASVSNNLDSAAVYEAINLSGAGTITITAAADNANKIRSSGNVKIGANANIAYSAIDLASTPIEITAGKTLTIDASMIDITKYFTTTVIPLTGLVTMGDGADLECTPPEETEGREVSFAENESTHCYELTITVTPAPFVYTIAKDVETGTWTWHGLTVDPSVVAAQTSGEIQKAGEGTATLTPQSGMTYTVNENGGTLKFGSELVSGMSVTVNEGGTFDLNGLSGKEMNLTLAGGKLTNSGATITGGNQIKTITLTANSEINAVNEYEIYAASYNTATTIALGEFTLTKTGSGQIKLINTTITGTGTFLISEGTVFSGESTTFDATATLAIGASGTYHQRGGRTTTVAKVVGTNGGKIKNYTDDFGNGTISGFELTGTIKIDGAGDYGTITNAAEAVAKVGERRDLNFAGAGQVYVQLTQAEINAGGDLVCFTTNTTEAVETVVGKVFLPDGVTDTTENVTIDHNTITLTHAAQIGTTYYLTLADAIKAVEADGTITLCKNCEAAITMSKNFSVALGSYTLSGTVSIGEDYTLTIPTAEGGKLTSTVTGSGTFVYDGKSFDGDSTFPTGFASDTWTGTVWLKNTIIAGANLNNLCNAKSVLRFTGVMGWLRNTTVDQQVETLELVDEDETLAFEMDDSSYNRIYVFHKLIGSGTFRCATKSANACGLAIEDITGFTGTLLSKSGTHHDGTTTTNPRPLYIGTNTGASSTASLISFADNVELRTNAVVTVDATTVSFGANIKVRVEETPKAGDSFQVIAQEGTTAGIIPTVVSVYVGSSETPETTLDYDFVYKTDGMYVNAVTKRVYLGWDSAQGGWTNGVGTVVTTIDDSCILTAKANDEITFTAAVTPHKFLMPESGTVTITGQNFLTAAEIEIPSGATLVCKSNADIGASTVVGAGTLAFDAGSAEDYAKDVPAASKLTGFTGTFQISSGRMQRTTPFASNVKVINGGQLWITGGTWSGTINASGNGWTYEKNVQAKTPLRIDGGTIGGSITATGTTGYYAIVIGNTAKLSNPSGWTVTGDVVAKSGTLTLGSGASGTAKLGDTLVMESGTALKLSMATTDNYPNYIASELVLQGCAVSYGDGSYRFAKINVTGASSITATYNKLQKIDYLTGNGTLNLIWVHTGYGSKPWTIADGNFTGTVVATGGNASNKSIIIPQGTALAAATVTLSTDSGITMSGDATIGTLNGNANAISGTGTLTLKGGSSSGVISGTMGVAIAGNVTLSGANTYTGGTTVKTGGTLTIGLPTSIGTGALTVENGATLDVGGNRSIAISSLAGAGTVKIVMTTTDLTAGRASIFSGTMTAPSGLTVSDGTYTFTVKSDASGIYIDPSEHYITGDIFATLSTETGIFTNLVWKYASGAEVPKGLDMTKLSQATITNTFTNATLTVDSNVAMTTFKIVSAADVPLAIAKDDAATLTFSTAFDISEAAGGVTIKSPLGYALDVTKVNGDNRTLTFDLGEFVEQEITSASSQSPHKFALKVVSGILNFTYGGGVTSFAGREVIADGATAIIRLNVKDSTGYTTMATGIKVYNGAQIQMQVRDTFKTPVELKEGTFTLMKGCGESGRAFDLYGDHTWTISAKEEATSANPTISYLKAVNDASEIDKTVIYRAGQWTIDVAANAKFVVDNVTLINKNSYTEMSSQPIIKTGDGELVLNSKSGSGSATDTLTAAWNINDGKVTMTDATVFGAGEVSIAEGATVEFDMGLFANQEETTFAFNIKGDDSTNRVSILNQAQYPWLKFALDGDDRGKIVVDKTLFPVRGLHFVNFCPKPGTTAADRDPNGRTSGWIDLKNYNLEGGETINLKDYKIYRYNLTKKAKPETISNLCDYALAPQQTIRVYTSEDYPNAEDHGGDPDNLQVEWYGTNAQGKVVKDGFDPIMIIPQKINPKKYPMVMLYKDTGNPKKPEILDQTLVPCDIDDGAIVELSANTNKIERSVLQDGVRTAYGPDVAPLYGVKDTKTDLKLLNKRKNFVPLDKDVKIELPINPFSEGTTPVANEIASVQIEYRVFDLNPGASQFVDTECRTIEEGDDDEDKYGAGCLVWTGKIPKSALVAGKLIQYRARITDRGGATWLAPRGLNKDVGHMWYGFVVQPETTTVVDEANKDKVCLDRLQTFLMFVDSNSRVGMDSDIIAQDKSKFPYGARVNIYDTQTHTYYDNVRIDLRGQTSASFVKKSHGLRFSKVAPLKCENPFEQVLDEETGELVNKEIECRKTSFVADYGDPTSLRQSLSCRLLGDAGVKVPFCYPVRLYLNGEYYQLASHSNRFTDEFVEDYLGLSPKGYAYKNVGKYAPNTPQPSGGTGCEKKTPDDDNESDLTVLNEYTARLEKAYFAEGGSISDADKVALTKTVMTNFNIAAWVNYLAAVRVTQENDDVWTNIGGYINKYHWWDNPNGDDTLMPIAYDLNLSWGQWYYGDDSVTPKPGIRANVDAFKCHPFYGGWQVRCHKTNGETMANANYAYETLYQNEQIREMFLRRYRTLMDKYLGAPGTAKEDTLAWQWVVAYTNVISGDIDYDHSIWEYSKMGTDQAHASQIWDWANGALSNYGDAIDDLWNNYFEPRRTHLYVTHSVTNVTDKWQIGYGMGYNAGIPLAQSETTNFNGMVYFTDETGKRWNEAGYSYCTNGIVQLCNTKAESLDLSGWTIGGTVEATFPNGTVIPAAKTVESVTTPGALWIVWDRPSASKALAEADGGTAKPVIINLDKTTEKIGGGTSFVLRDPDGVAIAETKFYVSVDAEGKATAQQSETKVDNAVDVPMDWIDTYASQCVNVNTNAQGLADQLVSTNNAANGIAPWQSYVLGLVPDIAESIPVIEPVQSTETTTIKFQLGGIEPVKQDAVNIKYKVWSGDKPGAKTTPSGDFVGKDEKISVALPESGVLYYLIEVSTPAK